MENTVRYTRRDMNLSQEVLARRIGVSVKTIRDIEVGQTSPSVKIALKLSKVLDVSVDDLFKLHESDWE